MQRGVCLEDLRVEALEANVSVAALLGVNGGG